MKYILLLLLAITCTNALALNFEAEELQFSLNKGFWEMDGLFHFANYADSMVSSPIFFPIPEDSLSLHPDIRALEVLGDSLAICTLSSQRTGGFGFILTMPSRHFCTVRIAYRQVLLGSRARYIITTANSWGKPLTFASYRLKVAEGILLTQLPFSLQQYNNDTYYWEFDNFHPQHEFEVQFVP